MSNYIFYPPTHAWIHYDSVVSASVLAVASGSVPATPTPEYVSLTLLPEMSDVLLYGSRPGFRMRITAIDPVNADPNIFLYVVRPLAPGARDHDAIFNRIASPVDLAEYQANVPDAADDLPLFRLDYIEIDFYTRHEAIAFRDSVVNDVTRLLDTLKQIRNLHDDEAIVIQTAI